MYIVYGPESPLTDLGVCEPRGIQVDLLGGIHGGSHFVMERELWLTAQSTHPSRWHASSLGWLHRIQALAQVI